ncbi:MAG: hypothetical protein BWY70_00027 [Bacteroidetes bacterium ADurb.Bin408]|nr:MAG: hypothetical protein BWY70_00027 [Bacteroidetes bacterium ADurb.Bin408]
MKISRFYYNIKSRIFFTLLLTYGALCVFLFPRCTSPSAQNCENSTNDSIARANAANDSIAKVDSIAKAKIAFEDSLKRVDSVAKADSLAKIKKPNPYKPGHPTTKYGVPYNMKNN